MKYAINRIVDLPDLFFFSFALFWGCETILYAFPIHILTMTFSISSICEESIVVVWPNLIFTKIRSMMFLEFLCKYCQEYIWNFHYNLN